MPRLNTEAVPRKAPADPLEALELGSLQNCPEWRGKPWALNPCTRPFWERCNLGPSVMAVLGGNSDVRPQQPVSSAVGRMNALAGKGDLGGAGSLHFSPCSLNSLIQIRIFPAPKSSSSPLPLSVTAAVRLVVHSRKAKTLSLGPASTADQCSSPSRLEFIP